MSSTNPPTTILILEDDLEIADMLSDFLSDETFKTLLASNQKEFTTINNN